LATALLEQNPLDFKFPLQELRDAAIADGVQYADRREGFHPGVM
jgi:hypothetical protein